MRKRPFSGIAKAILPVISILFLIAFCAPSARAAGFNNWSSCGPSGAVVKSLVVDLATPSTLYAGTANAGVYKSVNSGTGWSSANTGLPARAQINVLQPLVSGLYAGTNGNGLYKSSGATSWATVSGGWSSTANITSINGNNADVYVAINGGGVYKAVNAASWVALNSTLSNGNILSLAVVPTATPTLYAGSNGAGVFRSVDDGAIWGTLNTGLPASSTITALAVDSSPTPRIYAGTSLGKVYWIANDSAVWAETATQPSTGVSISAIVAKGTDIYVLTAGKGVFLSTDNGVTWTGLSGSLPNATVNALAFDQVSSFTYYSGTGGGVFKSTDSGVNWNDSNSGLANIDIRAIAIDPTTETIIYAGSAGGGLYRSSDGGATWLPANSGLTNTTVNAVAIDRNATATLYAATSGGIFKSINSGGSWTAATSQPIPPDVRAIVIDPASSSTLYAGTAGGGVFRSVDSGVNWGALNTSLLDLNVTALAFSATELFATTGTGGIFRWDGSAWNVPVDPPSTPLMSSLVYDSVAPASVFAGSNGSGVFRTEGGTSWLPFNRGMTNLSVRSLAASSPTPSFVTAGTGGGVFFTTDKGSNWSPMNTGLTDLTVNALAATTSPAKKVYAGTAGSGIFALNVSPVSTVTPAGATPATAVSYGKTNVADTKGIDFTLGNSGTVALQVSSLTVGGANSALFTVADGTSGTPCNRATLPNLAIPAGGSCTVKVNFLPVALGTWTASLAIGSNAPNQPVTVYLTGDAGPAPQATIDNFAAPLIRNPYSVTGAAVDNSGSGLAKVEVSFDFGAVWVAATITPSGPSSWNWNYTWASSADGTFNVRARAIDNNGFVQTNFTGLDKTASVDNTPPETTITVSPATLSNDPTPTFTFSTNEPANAIFDCSIDSTQYPGCSSPFAAPGLADGSHIFSVKAYDGVYPPPGNVDPTPATYNWAVDTTPPITALTAKPPLFSNSTDASLVFSANEANCTYSCTFDAGSSATCTSPYNRTTLPEGTHTFTVQATDPAGNQELAPLTYAWTVDVTLPTSTITAPSTDLTGTTYNVTGSSSDALSGIQQVQISFDSGTTWLAATDTAIGPAQPWSTWSYLWPLPINGTYTIQSRAIDRAGNIQAPPAQITNAIVANPPPTVAITYPAIGGMIGTPSSKSVTGTAAAAAGGLPLQRVQFASALSPTPPASPTWQDATGSSAWSYVWTPTEDGVYTIMARSLDTSGNSSIPESRTVTVDLTPPTSSIDSLTNPFVRSNAIQLSIAASDNLTGVQRVDVIVTDAVGSSTTSPATFNAVTGKWEFTSGSLADGSYQIRSQATDFAGNPQIQSTPYVITLDNIPPVTTITGSPVNPSNSAAPVFTFSANETATFVCTFDGVAAPCNSPASYSDKTTGNHTFTVQATDLAGNQEISPRSYTWFIDLIPPTVTAVTPPDGSTRVSISTPNITVTFDKVLSPATVTTSTFILRSGSVSVPGTVTYDPVNFVATFTPAALLSYAADYTATVTTGMRDPAGNALAADFSWSFSTAPDGDINLDGRVDIADAILALKVTVGRVTVSATAFRHGDTGPLQSGAPVPDGIIDGRDVMVILGRSIGKYNW